MFRFKEINEIKEEELLTDSETACMNIKPSKVMTDEEVDTFWATEFANIFKEEA